MRTLYGLPFSSLAWNGASPVCVVPTTSTFALSMFAVILVSARSAGGGGGGITAALPPLPALLLPAVAIAEPPLALPATGLVVSATRSRSTKNHTPAAAAASSTRPSSTIGADDDLCGAASWNTGDVGSYGTDARGPEVRPLRSLTGGACMLGIDVAGMVALIAIGELVLPLRVAGTGSSPSRVFASFSIGSIAWPGVSRGDGVV